MPSKTHAFFIFLSLILFSLSGWGAELKGVKMPDNDEVLGKKLVLNGMGIREVTVFGIVVRVYIAGLYIDKKSDSGSEILKANSPKRVRTQFLHRVSDSDMQRNWEKGIKANCEDKCEKISPSLEKFKNLLVSIKSDDKLTYTFDGKGVELELNEKKLGRVDDPDLAAAVLGTWIGKNASFPDLKAGLLTNKN